MLDGASKIVVGDIVSGLYTNDLAFVVIMSLPSIPTTFYFTVV